MSAPLNGQQFTQPALFEGAGRPALGDSNRAAYLSQKHDVTPMAGRIGAEPTGGRGKNMPAVGYPWMPRAQGAPRQQRTELAERTNYAHSPGQLVMGAHDLSQTHQLDTHGNVYVGKHSSAYTKGVGDQAWFDRHGPFNSPEHEQFWSDHAKVQDMRSSAVLHTGQHSSMTASHGYITGPMDPDRPIASIVRQGGVSYIADGHHRLAEARGRGDENVKVRVFDMDQHQHSAIPIPMPKVKRTGDEMRAHLEDDHGIHPGNFAMPLFHTQNVADRHDVLHRRAVPEHVHPNAAHVPWEHGTPPPPPGQKIPTGMFNF